MAEAATTESTPAYMKYWNDTLDWMQENRLKTVGGIWLTGVTGSLAYQWTKPIPTSLKIIHSRVYAQGITLGALALTAAIETYHHTSKEE
mmetsp:Transcript_20504/g.56852  ORF Transcript_20504/g.56852 Transcript_20504/m.56852 type:complete len:90 (+) Transcript_20504:157-426(+)|eukprot:CAMPEP_0117678838 /NCGR_PEP_ID=MMETSP0804-20121206/17507_1 /TAXON_ID=1074897 /ORGANISM="Tetraselmis astigmatica, Strain CCMP880" /LENGTH=89 /DNA_ID=CAMNT_0005488245 /DNA_START=353 /DNA_END=622 /DNA_ORIENTATION=-